MAIIVSFCGIICAIFSIYYAITSVFGIVLKEKKTPTAPLVCRIAAVIPARNEAAVIGRLVGSLKRQRYPEALYDIYVVPNNCSDDTEAVAREAGALILKVDGTIRSKGDVLRGAFAQLAEAGAYDAFCVFDADNLVDEGFFQAVNDARQAGYHVAQGFRDSKNPYDNWVSGSMSAFYWFMSRLYNESRFRLGMSCHLNGTGFMVSREAIEVIGWDTHTLTEDLEFTALCALAGYKVGWMPGAKVFDEQTSSFKVSCVQRRRWTAGSMQCLRRYLPMLLKKRTLASLDMAMLFMGNLLCLIGLIPGIGTALGMLPFFISHPWRIILLVGLGGLYYLGCCAAAALLYHVEGKLSRRSMPGVFGFPLFLVSWMPVNLVAICTPPPTWKVIEHTRGMEEPDR